MHAMASGGTHPSPAPHKGGGVLSPSDHRFIHGGLAASPVVNAQ